MNHLDTKLTITADSLLKYCLKCEAAEQGLTLSQLIRRYIIDGFEETTWGQQYKCWWEMRDYEENPEEYPKTDTEAIKKAMELAIRQREEQS